MMQLPRPFLPVALLVAMVTGTPQLSLAAGQVSANQAKAMLTMTTKNWVTFRTSKGRQLIYFNHLEAWRCGIRAVRYSINSRALDQNWQLATCSKGPVPAGRKTYLSLPAGSVASFSLQITYQDGTQSNIVDLRP